MSVIIHRERVSNNKGRQGAFLSTLSAEETRTSCTPPSPPRMTVLREIMPGWTGGNKKTNQIGWLEEIWSLSEEEEKGEEGRRSGWLSRWGRGRMVSLVLMFWWLFTDTWNRRTNSSVMTESVFLSPKTYITKRTKHNKYFCNEFL